MAGIFVSRGIAVPTAEAAALAAVAAALVWSEWTGNRRARVAASLVAGAACLALGASFFAGGHAGAGGSFLTLFAALLLSTAVTDGLPESADDLSGITPRQREIYLYERAGETTLWTIVALSVLYVNAFVMFDARLYFAAVLTAAAVTQFGFRFRSAQALSERRYFIVLFGVVLASILLISSAGGTTGPFIYFAYLAIYAGTIIAGPAWSMVTAGLYVAYVLIDLLFWWLAPGSRHEAVEVGHRAVNAVFLAATLLLTGVYTAWTGRRRLKTERALLAANRQLAEALKSAVHEREQTKRQADDLKGLNDDLIEMRSALMNVLEDVEESKRQIELDRRREVASLDALGEGVIATEKDGKIFLCNPAAASLLGLEAKAVIGQSVDRAIRLFLEDGDILQTEAFETAFAGKPASLGNRLSLLREDGRRVPVSGNVAPYFDETNLLAGIVIAFRDVAVERDIDRQKSDFISIASHQLRTPLSALRWYIDLLLAGDAGKLTPTEKEYLSDMSVSTIRMIKLVGDLLDITRIESGRLKPSPERVAARAFTEELAREFAPMVAAQGVNFTWDVASKDLSFRADPVLIHQAIANILANAVKYTPRGGSVTLTARPDGRMVVFTVKDTGVGIPRAQQYRVFDKFFRGENVVAKETVGSGLGLYVTRLIVERSAGQIWFESHEGKGTVFSVALPAAAPEGTMTA